MKFTDFPEDVRKAAIESFQNAIKNISPADKSTEEMQKEQVQSLARIIAEGYSELIIF